MKMAYAIVFFLLLTGLVFCMPACKDKQGKITSRTTQSKENVFEELRNIALGVTPAQLGLHLSADSTVVYGVVMDWEMNGSTVTLVSYQTGDASLYLSSGGGVVGGGKHENVNIAARRFVELANNYLGRASQSKSSPLPTTDEVAFYFLSNKGIYEKKENVKDFYISKSDWLKLFEEGNKVITALKQTTGNN